MKMSLFLSMLLYVTFIYHQALGQPETLTWLKIDCGAPIMSGDDNGVIWDSDDLYISSGEDVLVDDRIDPPQMSTLRYFPVGDDNCYTLPTVGGNRVLLRAGFYYGNYDNLSKPPVFGLNYDGRPWTTVTTSTEDEPIYHEMIYRPQGSSTSLCLVRANGGGIPFISTLEMVPIPANLYTQMAGEDAGFYLRSRINYGEADDIRYTLLTYDENFDRIWKGKEIQTYPDISLVLPQRQSTENEPPSEVTSTAIEATNPSESLSTLIFDRLLPGEQSACIILYFMRAEDSVASNDSRKFSIRINDRDTNRVVHLNSSVIGEVVTLYPVQVSGSVNLVLSPVDGTRSPPIINAAELFTVIDGSDYKISFSSSKCSALSVSIFYIIFLVVIMMNNM